MGPIKQRRQTAPLWRRWLLRPSYWVALASVLVYWDEKALHGEFVYDDDGSIRSNPVVNGQAPWTDAFLRDFWGTPMTDIQSHKSFRPITTLSFKLNWLLFPPPPSDNNQFPGEDRAVGTYSFHVVNVILHGVVSGLVTEAVVYVFTGGMPADVIAQIVAGALFGLHPVHAEAVSNVTSRGELLMSLFFLLAFVSYASHVSSKNGRPLLGLQYLISIYLIPWICMTLSLFSKEQGASTLITLVLYDLLQNYFSVSNLLHSLLIQRDPKAWAFARRAMILAVQTLLVCGWRYWLNGETKPDFIFDQNPAGFAVDRLTRAFSVTWVYCLYLWDALYPQHLTIDWSGKSIPLIVEWNHDDLRVWGVVALWLFAALAVVSLFLGVPPQTSAVVRQQRTWVLMAFLGFLFCPFLLSSNILVVVGLMKADRVIYLPLMGFCLLEAQLVRYVCTPRRTKAKRLSSSWQDSTLAQICHALLLVQLFFFCRKVHERNLAWRDPMSLWNEAYKINPQSHHTIYNCGYNLSLRGHYEQAEQVLREIAHPEVDGATTTFVYVMVLQNLGRCEEARPLIEQAMDVVAGRTQEGGPRNTRESTRRTESNLLVASAFCTMSIPERAKIMLKAVETDPTNAYALESAAALNEFIEQQRQMNDPHGLLRR